MNIANITSFAKNLFKGRENFVNNEEAKTREDGSSIKMGEISTYGSPYWEKSQLQPYNPDDLVSKKTLDVYEDMLVDDQVKAVTQMRKSAVLSTGWYIEPASKDKKDINIANFVHNCLSGGLETDLMEAIEEMLSAWDYGFSVTEKNFKYYKSGLYMGKIGFKSFKTRAPHSFEFRLDKYGNIIELIQYVDDGNDKNLPQDKFIKYTHKGTFGNPYGDSDLRAAHRSWYIKNLVIRYWAIYLEKFSMPPITGKYEPGKSKDDRDALFKMLKNMQANTVMLYPKDLEVEIKEIAQKGVGSYERAIDKMNTMIARSLLLPDLLGYSDNKGGTYNLGEKQLDIFMLTLYHWRRCIEDKIMNTQIIKPLINLNYGAQEKYPKFKLKRLSEEDQLELLNKWIIAADKGVVLPTEKDESHVREVLEFPQRKEEDILLPKKEKPTPFENLDNSSETLNTVNFEYYQKFKKKRSMSDLTEYEKKVDFKKINKDFDKLGYDTAIELGKIFTKTQSELLSSIKREKIIEENRFKEIDNLKLRHIPAVKMTFKKFMLDAYNNGRKDVLKEIKIKKSKFQIEATVGNLPSAEALKYLDNKAFYLTGLERDRILNEVKQILYSGLRNGKTESEIIFELNTYFTNDYGVMQKMPTGELKPIEKIPGRLSTVVRTNYSDAYNQGRLNMMQDPLVADFVPAYQYSAIMDSETTDFCLSWDGKIYKADDPIWSEINPPNHFNALVKGTKIQTKDGYKNIEDIKIGDIVLTHKGNLKEVYDTMNEDRDEAIYEIEADNGKKIEATWEHPILVKVNEEIAWKKAENIYDFIHFQIQKIREFLSTLNLNIYLYLAKQKLWIKIKSIKRKRFKGKVYNLAVNDDESYVANGISVHNCRSILVPILSDEKFKVDTSKPAVEPAKGF